MWLDPWTSKEALRWFLSKFIERDELDVLVQIYVRDILGHRIICRPSRGRYGEQGKDIAACEDEERKCYCSYVIKCGDLRGNLDGKYGILRQLEDALSIELESRDYHDKQRSAVVVHNGQEGNRGSLARYEKCKESLEDVLAAEGKLLRPVERWDLDVLTERLFPHGERLKEMEVTRQDMSLRHEFHDKTMNYVHRAHSYFVSGREDPHESHALLRQFYDGWMVSIQKYSPSLHRRLKEKHDEE